MAKRKAARRRRPAPGRTKRARQATPTRKAQPRAARKAASAKRTARPSSRKVVVRTKRSRPKASAARSATAKQRLARAKPAKSVQAQRRVAPKPAVKAVAKASKAVAKKAAPRPVAKTALRAPKAPARKLLPPELAKRKHVLDLGRDRRRVLEDDDPVSQTPPSSLGLDRSASAARSGRQELRERYDKHTETSPALTGGDVDADWESAYSVGDEAPGGDNPTPDQNVVDDIGVAVGVEYADNEELEGADRIVERDRHRWEYDPASSDDFDER